MQVPDLSTIEKLAAARLDPPIPGREHCPPTRASASNWQKKAGLDCLRRARHEQTARSSASSATNTTSKAPSHSLPQATPLNSESVAGIA